MLKLTCDICQIQIEYETRLRIPSLQYCRDCLNKVEKYRTEMSEALDRAVDPIVRVYVEQLKKEHQAKLQESLALKEEIARKSGSPSNNSTVDLSNCKHTPLCPTPMDHAWKENGRYPPIKTPMPYSTTINDVEARKAFIGKKGVIHPKGDAICNMGYYHFEKASEASIDTDR